MTWQTPVAFLMLVVIVLVVIYLFFRGKKQNPFLLFSTLKIIKSIHPGLRSYFVTLPKYLKLTSLMLAIVALARPQNSDTQIKRNVDGIDIVVALDISDSMLIEDMSPINRLEASKQTIKKFIEKRVSDRIGLVVFSGESYTRVPMTLDYPLLLKSLSEVSTSKQIKQGTAIGVALANAWQGLRTQLLKVKLLSF